MSKTDEEKDELKNFPEEMGVASDEDWDDYSHFKRNPQDSAVIRQSWNVFVHRLLPVLSLIYISVVLGMSISRGNILFDKASYVLGLVIIFWVAIAPMTWVFMVATGDLRRNAYRWYLWVAGSQAACGVLFYLLFPTNSGALIWVMQSFFISSVPIHIVIYFFFMKNWLPPETRLPFSIAGGLFLAFGLFVI